MPSDSEAILSRGEAVDEYLVEELIGSGGMSQVYRVRRRDNGEVFALKVLTRDGDVSNARARFKNEAILQYNLRHPAIAALVRYLEHHGKPCLVMEYVPGSSLDREAQVRGALPWNEAAALFRSLVVPVAFLHERQVAHRDLKLSNYRVDGAGKVRLLDFGISTRVDAQERMTQVGQVIGTFDTLAPERLLGMRGDERSDVWALGVILYQLLAGIPPFGQGEEVDTGRIRKADYVPLRKLRRGLPTAAERIIARCLARRPADRYPNAAAVLQDLDSIASEKTPSREWLPLLWNWRSRLVVAGVILVAAAALAWILASRASGSVPDQSPIFLR